VHGGSSRIKRGSEGVGKNERLENRRIGCPGKRTSLKSGGEKGLGGEKK